MLRTLPGAQRAHELELNKATAVFEHAIGSALFLLNGGAVVAFDATRCICQEHHPSYRPRPRT